MIFTFALGWRHLLGYAISNMLLSMVHVGSLLMMLCLAIHRSLWASDGESGPRRLSFCLADQIWWYVGKERIAFSPEISMNSTLRMWLTLVRLGLQGRLFSYLLGKIILFPHA